MVQPGKPKHGDPPADEREHFIQCPGCGAWLDMRDLAQIIEHEKACEGTPAPRN